MFSQVFNALEIIFILPLNILLIVRAHFMIMYFINHSLFINNLHINVYTIFCIGSC